MKRLILISTLFLFIFASCDGPVNNFTGKSSEYRTPTLSEKITPRHHYSIEPVRPDTNRYGLTRVTFQQHEGVPVEGAEYIVQIYEEGRVGMANGYYYPNLEVSASPVVSKSRVLLTALSDLDVRLSAAVEDDTKLVMYRDEGQFCLAWKQLLSSKEHGIYWRYFVNANSGAVLHKFNLVTDVTGEGDVYPTSSCLSSVTNESLYELAGSGYLEGTYADVYNSSSTRAYSYNNSFQYATSNTHFDETNI